MKMRSILIILVAFLSCSAVSMNQQQRQRQKRISNQLVKFKANLTPYENRILINLTQERLSNYLTYFRDHAELNNISWTLLAAVAYQESQWLPDAKSHKGAIGLMQLTAKTATVYEVVDRKNAIESIRAGASYLKYLYEKTPKKLKDPERWAIAIASYNIGWGHMKDAFQLATSLNLNPYVWEDLKKVLPMLSDEKHFVNLDFGYAKGNETVEFVENVIRYNEALSLIYNVKIHYSKL